MKTLVVNAPALKAIEYESEAPVYIAVDTSYIAIGFVLGQENLKNPKARFINRFGSITLNETESNYSQPKLELYGLFRALKRARLQIIGVKNLKVEVDAKYIKGMLNNPDIQPNATINRWIAGVLLFGSFELIHIPGILHGPDGLSHRRPQPNDEPEPEEDFEDWIDKTYGLMHIINGDPTPQYQVPKRTSVFATIGLINYEHRPGNEVYKTALTDPYFCFVSTQRKTYAVAEEEVEPIIEELDRNDNEADDTDDTDEEDSNPDISETLLKRAEPINSNHQLPYSDKAKEIDQLAMIKEMCRTLVRPDGLSDRAWKHLVNYGRKFFLKDDRLWRLGNNGHHRIVAPRESRIAILKAAHDDLGHKGIYPVMQQIAQHYWWSQFGEDVKWYIKTCHLCQIRQTRYIVIPPSVPMVRSIFRRAHMDTMAMPKSGGYNRLVQARCACISYVEARALHSKNHKTLGNFIMQEILCCWGVLEEIVMDNGSAFIAAVEYLRQRYGINHIRISGYNSRANGLVEVKHRPF